MESAIRWSPHSTDLEQRFLSVDVTGRAFRLCKVKGNIASNTPIQHEIISTLNDIPVFRAFDWSASNENLIAVGQSSGGATILRLDASAKESISFPVRNQRYCNAVALSTHGLVASGLDRIRNDFCLNIWDVNQRLSPAGGSKGFPEPLRKLASSEPITSIKFFRDQPDTLVAGVKGQFLRIYDLREGSGSPSLQFQTRCVHNLAIDWLDENYIASCQPYNESTICVWDRRVGARLASPSVGSTSNNAESGQSVAALQIHNVFDAQASTWSLRFSNTNRGYLGALSSTGHFRGFAIAKDHQSEEYRASIDETFGEGSFKNYAEPVFLRRQQDVRYPYNHPTRGCGEKDRMVAFDFLNMSLSNQPSAIALDGHGRPQIVTARPPSAPVSISSRGVLVYGLPTGDRGFKAIHPLSEDEEIAISEVVSDIRARVDGSPLETPTDSGKNSEPRVAKTQPLSSRDTREQELLLVDPTALLTAQEALTLSTVAQARCREGYMFNEALNRSIVSDDPALQDLWDWIERAKTQSSGSNMLVNGFDLSFVGINEVWTGDLDHDFKQRNLEGKFDGPAAVTDAIVQLAARLHLADTKRCDTSYPELRGLCLYICGAIPTYKQLEKEVKALSADSQHSKAAALAVFQDEAKLAYVALRNNDPLQAHKLLAMAIAGAAKGDTSTDWEDTCADISQQLTDPYARAVLALVSKGDWHSVLKETTLPLRYRVEVALRWLPDEELTAYLSEATAEAIREGDVEGVMLTGLGHLAMGLFQSYIEKFSEVQTPVLAMSYTVPRFVNSAPLVAQFESWREGYRYQMNSWKMQFERARFDVASRQLAVTADGRKLLTPPPQQISLVCNYCTRPVTQHDASSQISPSTTAETVHPTAGHPLGTATMSGTVCPRCGRHLPRCGVCNQWLGTTDPMSKGGAASEAEDEQSRVSNIMKRFMAFCTNCNHGFHAHHADEWFSRHRLCPVPDCTCMCLRKSPAP
ncbi:hypothetical protein N7539_001508 [Penicillium diatomitis]|uniref:Uncharacterized protein n=1 Tax=Penicillium diatomitis TaxID=2819901 RepID=A0A9W9XGS9_9EURO|nr:uncharacterized protein N7539_001508 [Penicillium diatomitis]KAJ5492762.1 hypothetical protein N7539_001508 [Penicillium diatomitis]